MIAHRLDTIKTAENILHLQDSKTVVSAEKGSEKYKEIMDEIQSRNYAHQIDKENQGEENNEEQEQGNPLTDRSPEKEKIDYELAKIDVDQIIV